MNSAERRRGLLRLALAGTFVLLALLTAVAFVKRDPQITQSINVASEVAVDTASPTSAFDSGSTTSDPTSSTTTLVSHQTFVDLVGTTRPGSMITIESQYSTTFEVESEITGEWNAHVEFVGAPIGETFSGTITTEDGTKAFQVTL